MKRANFIIKKKRDYRKPLSAILILSIGIYAYTSPAVHTMANRTIASVTLKPVTPMDVAVAPAPVAPAAVIAKAPAPAPVAAPSVKVNDEFAEIEKRLHAQNIPGLESLEREKNAKGIRITLNSDVFFRLGTAKIEETSKDSIQQIVTMLKPLSSMSVIEIEGHTDGSPVIRQKPNYPSNWELSAARAASLIPFFSSNGFFKDQLKIVGYGDSHPIFSNYATQKISAKNRRIVLRVYAQEEEAKI